MARAIDRFVAAKMARLVYQFWRVVLRKGVNKISRSGRRPFVTTPHFLTGCYRKGPRISPNFHVRA